jgi:phytoene dehydrogenase-like protein
LTANYYDVVVIGMELGPLAAGALLAKRGFRVLVVGHGRPSDRYRCCGHSFTHRPFMMTSTESPAIKRVFKELGITQQMQLTLSTPSPLYQVVLPNARLDVHRDPSSTAREVRREFPSMARHVDGIFSNIGRINGEIDKLLANDVIVPPESFFEKREFSRAEVQNPFRTSNNLYFFDKRHMSQEFGDFMEAPLRFETAGVTDVPQLVRFRQMGGWMFDCQAVSGGRDGIAELFVDQIVGHGGDRQPHQQIGEIAVRRGRIAGVRIADRDEITGCRVVLTDLAPMELSHLVPPASWTKQFHALLDNCPPPQLGYSINMGLAPEVIPHALANTAFAASGPGLGADLLRIERVPQENPDMAALHVSCIVPPDEKSSIETGAMRDKILDKMRKIIPFMDGFIKVIHSPFDGFGALVLNGTNADNKNDVPPIPHPEEIPRWLIRPPISSGSLGIENLPHRSGIKGLLMAGSQVVSGLSTEGEFVAGWGAARIAAKMDPRRERLVRSMRSKVEM